MFGSKNKQNTPKPRQMQPATKPAPTAPTPASAEHKPARQSASAAPAPVGSGSGSRTHIGQTVRVQGELTGSEDLIIDGSVEGRVVLEGHSLTIGEHGNINAELWADNVFVSGRVVGDIHAIDRIEVSEGGSVVGDLQAPKVVLAEGARFKGSVDMGGEVTPAPSQPAPFAERTDPKSDFASDPEPSRTKAEKKKAAKTDAQPQAKAEPKADSKDVSDIMKDAAADEPAKKEKATLASVLKDFDPANP